MIRMNRDILMFSFLVLVVAALAAAETERTELVAAIVIPSLVGIWVFSRVQVKRLERNAENEIVAILREVPSSEFEGKDSGTGQAPVIPCPLSDREVQVLSTIAVGNSNKGVAVALGIKEQTVKNHLKHIFRKMQVYDRMTAILIATRAGWIAGRPPAGAPVGRRSRDRSTEPLQASDHDCVTEATRNLHCND
jgi:DNA-binding CsgD family transcriptional regulator